MQQQTTAHNAALLQAQQAQAQAHHFAYHQQQMQMLQATDSQTSLHQQRLTWVQQDPQAAAAVYASVLSPHGGMQPQQQQQQQHHSVIPSSGSFNRNRSKCFLHLLPCIRIRIGYTQMVPQQQTLFSIATADEVSCTILKGYPRPTYVPSQAPSQQPPQFQQYGFAPGPQYHLTAPPLQPMYFQTQLPHQPHSQLPIVTIPHLPPQTVVMAMPTKPQITPVQAKPVKTMSSECRCRPRGALLLRRSSRKLCSVTDQRWAQSAGTSLGRLACCGGQ